MSRYRITTISRVPGYQGVPTTKLFRSQAQAEDVWRSIMHNARNGSYLSAVFLELHSPIGDSHSANIIAAFTSAAIREASDGC